MTDFKQVSAQSRNLYLVGFMGTGKSAVGRRLADKLGYRFLDSDREIEQNEGRSITDIFAEDGEAAFREMERSFIESGHPQTGCVVSCGGGLVTGEGMPDLLRSKGFVTCLWASPETIHNRTKDSTHRPLLQASDPLERIRFLLMEREPHYLSAGKLVSTDNRTLSEVTETVLRLYRAENE